MPNMENLLAGPPPTLLPTDAEADAALARGDAPSAVAAAFPSHLAAWAALADAAYGLGDAVASYAYARVGYHRGLDALRRSGWKGHGPVPWSHPGNRGFLRSLHALGRAADAIGELDEAERCAAFLVDCDPSLATGLPSVE